MLLKGRGSAPDRAFEASLQDQPFEHAVQMAQQHDIAAQPGEGEMEFPIDHQTLISEILLDQLFVAMIDRAQLGEFIRAYAALEQPLELEQLERFAPLDRKSVV